MKQSIIDNKHNGILGDALIYALKPNACFWVIVAYFNMYAIKQLDKELNTTNNSIFLIQNPFNSDHIIYLKML